MNILIPYINWIIIFILLKTFIKKFILRKNIIIANYYSMPINNLLIINFIKDTFIFFMTALIYVNGLNINNIFPNTSINLINWILIFILSKSIFELFVVLFIKKNTNLFSPILNYIQITLQNFTVKSSLSRSIHSLPWIIITYLFYKYT